MPLRQIADRTLFTVILHQQGVGYQGIVRFTFGASKNFHPVAQTRRKGWKTAIYPGRYVAGTSGCLCVEPS